MGLHLCEDFDPSPLKSARSLSNLFPTAAARQQQTNRNDFTLCRVMVRGQQRSCPGAVSRSLVWAAAGEMKGRSLSADALLRRSGGIRIL
ncbi:MAG: hypothetical protein MH252_07230 [Thermosynechococcaceae cyanobacterium MS004]|nr:hypothetical protein [Thermosynechococcaceae cyanobacterium MS004]